MDNTITPKRAMKRKTRSSVSTPVMTIPASPFMKQLGFGTGVIVYLMERYSPRKGCYKSPWAVKKISSKMNRRRKATLTKCLDAEAKLLKSLKHPNIIGYRSYSRSADGSLCLAMEASESSLADLIERRSESDHGPFEAKTILKVCREMCQGLNYLHNTCYLLHGDLKSANVLVTGDFDQVKLCDFGVALKLDKNGNQKNKKEHYIGTECWSAPEALIGDTISQKTDMFAFGLVLWEMISLSVPHLDKLNFDDSVLEKQSEEEYHMALGQRPSLPDTDLDNSYLPVLEIFYVCTEQDPTKRPTAHQVETIVQEVSNLQEGDELQVEETVSIRKAITQHEDDIIVLSSDEEGAALKAGEEVPDEKDEDSDVMILSEHSSDDKQDNSSACKTHIHDKFNVQDVQGKFIFNISHMKNDTNILLASQLSPLPSPIVKPHQVLQFPDCKRKRVRR